MTNGAQTLSVANIKYLLVLREHDRDGKGVRCVDVAETLGITKPSVHSMMGTLQQMELVEKPRYGVVRFTPEGRVLADRYAGCLDVICRHLGSLLPQETDVRAVACALAAKISIGALEQMCSRLTAQAG